MNPKIQKLIDESILQQSVIQELEYNIQKMQDELSKEKDANLEREKSAISIYCSENNYADVVRTLDLLLKYPGMAGHDHKTVEEFKEAYPQKLTTRMIMDFEDIKDLYRRYLDSGGENDE